MTRIVFTIWWISGILSLLALLFPALIVIGLFLLVLPGLMLVYLHPTSSLLRPCLLVANLLFGRLRGKRQFAAYALFLGTFAALDIAIPWSLNRSLDQHWDNLPGDDSTSYATIHSIALLFAQRQSQPKGPQVATDCHRYLCRRLLTDQAVQAVLIGSPPAADHTVLLDLQLPVTSYRIEHRAACFAGESEARMSGTGKVVDQISDGVCLTAEPATLAASDLIIMRDRLSGGPYPPVRALAPFRGQAPGRAARRLPNTWRQASAAHAADQVAGRSVFHTVHHWPCEWLRDGSGPARGVAVAASNDRRRQPARCADR